MWAAPDVASAICSARARRMAPPIGAVSRVRSPLAARTPGLFDMTAQLQHGIERFGRRNVCEASGQIVPPLLKPVQQVRQRLNRVSPLLRSTAPIGRPAVSDNDRWLCRRSRDGSFSSRPIGCGSFGGGRGAIAAGRWSWHSRASYSVTRHEWNGGDNAFLRCTAGRRCWCPWDR